ASEATTRARTKPSRAKSRKPVRKPRIALTRGGRGAGAGAVSFMVSLLLPGRERSLPNHTAGYSSQIRKTWASDARCSRRGGKDLLPEVAGVAGGQDGADDRRVVQLLRLIDLVAAGVAARVVVGDVVLVVAEGADDVPLHVLHVVDVVEQLEARRADHATEA